MLDPKCYCVSAELPSPIVQLPSRPVRRTARTEWPIPRCSVGSRCLSAGLLCPPVPWILKLCRSMPLPLADSIYCDIQLDLLSYTRLLLPRYHQPSLRTAAFALGTPS